MVVRIAQGAPGPLGRRADAGMLRCVPVVHYLKKRCRKRLGNAQAFSDKHVKKYTVYCKKSPTAPCVVGFFMIK